MHLQGSGCGSHTVLADAASADRGSACGRACIHKVVHSVWTNRLPASGFPGLQGRPVRDRRGTARAATGSAAGTVADCRPGPQVVQPIWSHRFMITWVTLTYSHCCNSTRACRGVLGWPTRLSRCRAVQYACAHLIVPSHRDGSISPVTGPSPVCAHFRRFSHEAHVPAQQPPSCQEARLPCPNADAGRPVDHQVPSSSWTLEAQRLGDGRGAHPARRAPALDA